MKSVFLLQLNLVFGLVISNSARTLNGQDSAVVPFVTRVDARNNDLNIRKWGMGSFVTRRHVLTQAQLVHGFSEWYLSFASNNVANLEFDFFMAVFVHPDFNPETVEHDLAIGLAVTSQLNRKLLRMRKS